MINKFLILIEKIYDFFIIEIIPKIEVIKKYVNEHYKLFCGYYVLAMWLIIILGGTIVFQNNKINKLKNRNIDLTIRSSNLERDLKYEKEKRLVEIKLINEKVDCLYTFIKKTFPYFDDYNYPKLVDEALKNPDKTNDLPEELFNIYVTEKFIKPHGVQQYQWILKDCAYPVDPKSGFTTCKLSEYGTYRNYGGYMKNLHEGIDVYTYYNHSVYSVYDGIITDVYYSDGGGWTIEQKFRYKLKDGNEGWYFVRYRHVQEIYVKKNDRVIKGQIIANIGTTGSFSTGLHLHFELWKWNQYTKKYNNINPVANSTWNNKMRVKI